MKSFRPDMDPRAYGVVEEQEWTVETVYVCRNHDPPYYSKKKPVEVVLR